MMKFVEQSVEILSTMQMTFELMMLEVTTCELARHESASEIELSDIGALWNKIMFVQLLHFNFIKELRTILLATTANCQAVKASRKVNASQAQPLCETNSKPRLIPGPRN